MRRRTALAAGAAAALAAGMPPAAAQTPRRVGVLAPSTLAKEEVTLKPFFDEMRRLGWTEGRNLVFDRAYADDKHQDLPRLAAALVARAPDVIFAPPAPAAQAARRATTKVPIVFGTAVDPVGSGLVDNLARPGGNVTGITSIDISLAPKRLELARELIPGLRRLGLINDPTDPRSKAEVDALVPLAASMGLTLVVADGSDPKAFEAAVQRLIEQRVDAILQVGSLGYNLRERLIALTLPRRVPVIGSRAQLADAGALLAYGASLAEQLRRAAQMVDKLLRGARIADIPVEQPSVFELVVNLKTARALQIKLPQTMLLRADRVIE